MSQFLTTRVGFIAALMMVMFFKSTGADAGQPYRFLETVPGTAQAQDIIVIEPDELQFGQRASYQPLSGNILNPERGFYVQSVPLKFGGERTNQSVERLLRLRTQDGVTMVRWYFVLDTYLTRDLDADILAYIETQFSNARTAGMKVIPRFTYNYGAELDAPLDRTLAHMEQLRPLIQRNVDVIAFVEAGWVGKWGEWHTSINGHFTGATANPAARTVLDRWLEMLPQSRMVALRFVRHKQQFYGTEPLNATTAHRGSDVSRIGAHNDCFLYNSHNRGTYNGNDLTVAENRAFLHADNLYVPQGGETCDSGPGDEVMMSCPNALRDMAYLRYSTLNVVYHPDSLQTWRNQRCFDEIARRLGYRFVLSSLTSASMVRVGGHLPLALNLRNEGFTAPYNPRDVRVILRNAAGQTWSVQPQNPVDPRFWSPDMGTFMVDLSIQLPDGLPAGDYELLLHLPDPEPTLASRPEYAIQMANANVWEASTGYNRLLTQITVTDSNPQPQTTAVCPGAGAGGARGDNAPHAPRNICVDVRQGQPLLVWSDDPNAQWFNVFVIGPKGGVPVRDLWFPKLGALGSVPGQTLAACNGTICSAPIPSGYPLTDGGGEYQVWMRAWGTPNGRGISGQYSKGGMASFQGQTFEEFNITRFSVANEPPSLPANIAANGVSSGQPTLTWQAADGVVWYQVWIGSGGTTAHMMNWTFAGDLGCIAKGSTCTLTLSGALPPGTYDVWMNSWGPGGFNQVDERVSEGWAKISQFTVGGGS